jgi:hypothetical protein
VNSTLTEFLLTIICGAETTSNSSRVIFKCSGSLIERTRSISMRFEELIGRRSYGRANQRSLQRLLVQVYQNQSRSHQRGFRRAKGNPLCQLSCAVLDDRQLDSGCIP